MGQAPFVSYRTSIVTLDWAGTYISCETCRDQRRGVCRGSPTLGGPTLGGHGPKNIVVFSGFLKIYHYVKGKKWTYHYHL